MNSDSALSRGVCCAESITLLRLHADRGHWQAARRLAELLVEQGRVDEAITLLRQRADHGDAYAGDQLTLL